MVKKCEKCLKKIQLLKNKVSIGNESKFSCPCMMDIFKGKQRSIIYVDFCLCSYFYNWHQRNENKINALRENESADR